jgi:FkbM family methyltransferase
VSRLLPPISSIAYWLRIIADCRASSLVDSAKVLTNRSVFATRLALRRFGILRLGTSSGWLDSPFRLRGLVKWSPASSAWYVLEDYGTDAAMARSREEPEEWLMEALSGGMTVIDVGAHQGRYVIQFSRHVGETGLVVAVEPEPRNLELLTRNLKLNGINNVRLIRAACWSCRESLQLLHSSTLDLSQVSKSPEKNGDLIGLPLDHLVGELGLRRVDQVKIDVEGAELEVLEGGREMLREFRPRLFVECHRTLSRVFDWLQRHCYKVLRQKNHPHHGEGFGWILALPDEERVK